MKPVPALSFLMFFQVIVRQAAVILILSNQIFSNEQESGEQLSVVISPVFSWETLGLSESCNTFNLVKNKKTKLQQQLQPTTPILTIKIKSNINAINLNNYIHYGYTLLVCVWFHLLTSSTNM